MDNHTKHKNSVELIGTYGSDLTHAASAWTSTERELTEERIARVDKLIEMLMTEEHHTPFEKSGIHFICTTDIATHIHLLKHRIGVSINAESARYKELGKIEDKYLIPSDWPENLQDILESATKRANETYHNVLKDLQKAGVSSKRAKESARYFLPYNTQITADVMFNFRSFMHFQILRNDDHAQLEIHEIAQEMWRLLDETGKFPLTMASFTEWRKAKSEFREFLKNRMKLI